MPGEVQPVDVDVDEIVRKVYLKAIDVVGGLRRLVEYRNLTWVPSLIEASYIVVLHELYNKTADEIAEFLGISSSTVYNVLRADTEKVLEKLEEERQEKDLRTHVAGGIAKLAFHELLKSGEIEKL
ncbi:conserved hypothetical protein [Thermobaculum terrenum ATCC BAA-798]|uniref:Regulatory domain protein n=1 Tax=Thermobaculum terrenum (strain ATCC BAA-798 / CCMEE 7001 / YNP1) TaxID=525904 RepID=D1CC53_THET1|nr:hypothetical protein [Thermobaculum terrenum]ACZ42368.1 conserved hypothetical protein [Thermobaculum terrenum ATCC BAA-798]